MEVSNLADRDNKGAIHILEVFLLSIIVFLILIGAGTYIRSLPSSPYLSLSPTLHEKIENYNFSSVLEEVQEQGFSSYYLVYVVRREMYNNASLIVRCTGNVKKAYLFSKGVGIVEVCESDKRIEDMEIDKYNNNTLLISSLSPGEENLTLTLYSSPYTIYIAYYYDPYNALSSSFTSSFTIFRVINETHAYNLVVLS